MPAPNISTSSSDVEMLVTCMPRVGEDLDHAAGDRVGDDHGDERDEGQDRRAVDRQQQRPARAGR